MGPHEIAFVVLAVLLGVLVMYIISKCSSSPAQSHASMKCKSAGPQGQPVRNDEALILPTGVSRRHSAKHCVRRKRKPSSVPP